jgi:hypothetical protein
LMCPCHLLLAYNCIAYVCRINGVWSRGLVKG